MVERLLSSFFTGALLSLSGTIIMASTHNPMASTSTLGISGVAVLVCLISYFLNLILESFSPGAWENFDITTIGLIVSLPLLGALKLAFGRFNSIAPERFGHELEMNSNQVLLLGITFNIGMASLFALMHFIFLSLNLEFPSDLWFGSFKFASSLDVIRLVTIFLVLMIWAQRAVFDLELMCFGPHLCMNLKIPWKKRLMQAMTLALMAEIVICLEFGLFGLVGLTFPLFWRQFNFFSQNLGRELRWASLGSGLIFCLLDYLCYQLPIKGTEIPVGVLAMLAGSLVLIFSLWKTQLAKKR